MPFTVFLKKLLDQFVETYEALYSKTIVKALLWTILCFAIAQVLAAYSNYDANITIQPVSVLSYYILRFSRHDTYSYVDITKTIFIYFVALFSVNLLKKVTVRDVLYLLGIFIVSALLDIALFRLDGQAQKAITNQHLMLWIEGMIYFFRLYFPLLLFAIGIQLCSSKINFTFKKLGWLLVALWLFNELSYEALMLIRSAVFGLITFPFKTNTYRYVTESLLGIPLIASFFLGYFCAMTAPFELLEE